MLSVDDLQKYGFEGFLIREIPIGRPELTLTCIDGIDNDQLKNAVAYAKMIADERYYRTFIRLKELDMYRVYEASDIISIQYVDDVILHEYPHRREVNRLLQVHLK
nr:MAG TPA: hypothetical protein [Caudoviricetes sp.]